MKMKILRVISILWLSFVNILGTIEIFAINDPKQILTTLLTVAPLVYIILIDKEEYLKKRELRLAKLNHELLKIKNDLGENNT